MKKIYLLSLILLLIISSVSVFAEEITTDTFLSYEEYQKLTEEGFIGEDVSYEYLKELNDQIKQLEKTLENDKNISRIKLSDSTTLKAGDIIITNSTSSAGIGGHAAIAISSTEILHIAGPKKPVTVVSPSKFKSLYDEGWIRVYRINNSTAAKKAATWAKDTYKDSSAIYKMTKDLTTTHETYCSKIVFQAYYYGAGTKSVDPTWEHGLKSSIVLPYHLPDVLNGGSYTCTLEGEL